MSKIFEYINRIDNSFDDEQYKQITGILVLIGIISVLIFIIQLQIITVDKADNYATSVVIANSADNTVRVTVPGGDSSRYAITATSNSQTYILGDQPPPAKNALKNTGDTALIGLEDQSAREFPAEFELNTSKLGDKVTIHVYDRKRLVKIYQGTHRIG
jgi:hypothetical protein